VLEELGNEEQSETMNETCPHCGGRMLGDGYHEVPCCENADRPDDVEPDASPIYCNWPNNKTED